MFSSLQLINLRRKIKPFLPTLIAAAFFAAAWLSYCLFGEWGLVSTASILIIYNTVLYSNVGKWVTEAKTWFEYAQELEHNLAEQKAATEEAKMRLDDSQHRAYTALGGRHKSTIERMIDLRRQRFLLLSLLTRSFPSGIRRESGLQEWESDRVVGIDDTLPLDAKSMEFQPRAALVPYLYVELPTNEQMRVPLSTEEVSLLSDVPAFEGARRTVLETVSFDHFADLLKLCPEMELAMEIRAAENEGTLEPRSEQMPAFPDTGFSIITPHGRTDF